VDSIRPRVTSPVSGSNASKVICARCTSNPATIAVRASSEAPVLPHARVSRRAEEALAHAIFTRIAVAPAVLSGLSDVPPRCDSARPAARPERALLRFVRSGSVSV
jgi:hypothetical protein